MNILNHNKMLKLFHTLCDTCTIAYSASTEIKESAAYSACYFNLNNRMVQFRVAKITPKKIGQFVAIWKRNTSGETVPYDMHDHIDVLIIAAADKNKIGFFVFSKSVLRKHDIISVSGIGGKRGMRVYPPWDKAESKQAIRTQQWQTNYFVESYSASIDCLLFSSLLNSV